MRHKYLWTGSIISIVLLLDQITKYIVETRIRLYDVIAVVPGFFNLTHVRNRGAAFGILANLPGAWRSAFFITITLAAVVVIALLIRKTQERLLVAAFSLIAGGAIGNVIDRIRYGEVVDFIQWYVKSYYWPSFNVADSAISIGVGLLAIDMLFRKQQEQMQLNDK
ncbi:MAG TPA: signal peptidase II [Nitrospirota bacterium]